MARPLIEIDWSQVDKMCEIHCTGEEQASILGVDYDTLNSACKREKGQNFSDYFRKKASGGKMSLRRRQYTSAMDGNTTMMVWLGKNWLGQSDMPEPEPQDLPPIVIERADEANKATG
tara:strand:- start:265 stop:618 length:354 start_codon:yes stop_codon:yes gene_type:complete